MKYTPGPELESFKFETKISRETHSESQVGCSRHRPSGSTRRLRANSIPFHGNSLIEIRPFALCATFDLPSGSSSHSPSTSLKRTNSDLRERYRFGVVHTFSRPETFPKNFCSEQLARYRYTTNLYCTHDVGLPG